MYEYVVYEYVICRYIYIYPLRIQSPSENSHYHDESVIGPPNHHVTMGLDPSGIETLQLLIPIGSW